MIVALVVLAGAVITLIVTAGATTPSSYGWFESALQRAADATGGNAAAIIAVGVIIALGMVALLLFELIPVRKAAPLLISSTEEGVTTIDQDSVRLLAEKTATSAVSNVRDIRCVVGEKAGGLTISCRASVALGSNIPEVGAELQNKVKDAVEKLTGLPVVKVDVKAKYETVKARLAVR